MHDDRQKADESMHPVPSDIDLLSYTGTQFIEHLFRYIENLNMKTVIFTFDLCENLSQFLTSESVIITYDAVVNARNSNIDYDPIAKFLKDCNIPELQRGYKYLRDSFYTIYKMSMWDFAITKDVYPVVARENNTTISCVESSIRSCLRAAWKKSITTAPPGLCLYFDKCPTNSEYISFLCKQLRMIFIK